MENDQIEVTRRERSIYVAKSFADDLAIHPDNKPKRYLEYADDDLRAVILSEQTRRQNLTDGTYASAVVADSGNMAVDFDDIYNNDSYEVSLFHFPAKLVEGRSVGDIDGDGVDDASIMQVDVGLYMPVISLADPDNIKPDVLNSQHVCPNCGAPDKIGHLIEQGCQYCKSRFTISDLYPRVFDYYLISEQSIESKKNTARLLTHIGFYAIPLFLNVWVLFLWGNSTVHFSLDAKMIGLLFFLAAALAGIVGEVLYQIADRKIFSKVKSNEARIQIAEAMKGISPDFSYEYFESDVVSSVKKVVLSDDLSICPTYGGQEKDLGFGNVISCYYMGNMEYIRSFIHLDRFIVIDLKLPLRITRYENDMPNIAVETYEVRLVRHKENLYAPGFSFSAVECPNCDASFNAFKSRRCPYCGQVYDASEHAWVVSGIIKSD